MEETFNLVAQSRANYYTPGSPVQFCRVELLRGDQSGDNAVCLTFKNIGATVITALDVRFKCKGVDGVVLCEDSFHYADLQAGEGELFGQDDAVFITRASITSVDVMLEKAYAGAQSMDLSRMPRVRIPAPKKLQQELSDKLQEKTGRQKLKYMPQVLEQGWYCACGAFHPNEENTVYCSECGSDRILLQNVISGLMQPDAAGQPQLRADEPTRVIGSVAVAHTEKKNVGSTRTFDPPAMKESWQPSGEMAEKRVSSSQAQQFVKHYQADVAEETVEPVAENPGDELAEALIRWVPALTVLICAAIVLCGFVYCHMML